MSEIGKDFVVLRYGHRDVRDYRVTSHCSMVARAFGASKIIVCGAPDDSMKKSVDDVTGRWGGPFTVEFVEDWKEEYRKLKKKGYCFVHLTMYGEQLIKKEKELQKKNKLCIIVGSQKVEREVYEKADYNISVTTQPHSEIAALAVCLDRVQKGKEMEKVFKKAKIKIKPEKRGKKVINLNSLGGRR